MEGIAFLYFLSSISLRHFQMQYLFFYFFNQSEASIHFLNPLWRFGWLWIYYVFLYPIIMPSIGRKRYAHKISILNYSPSFQCSRITRCMNSNLDTRERKKAFIFCFFIPFLFSYKYDLWWKTFKWDSTLIVLYLISYYAHYSGV